MSHLAERVSPSFNVADEVRAFYERFPYPPPIDDLEKYRRDWQGPQRRRAEFHLYWPGRAYREDQSILIAGCGTSQAAKHALRWPAAQVTGIDCSATSVRHTERLKKKYEMRNLQVHELEIEDVRDLGMSFDQVVCTGVLHHLSDPVRALNALRTVLNPGGAMQTDGLCAVREGRDLYAARVLPTIGYRSKGHRNSGSHRRTSHVACGTSVAGIAIEGTGLSE